MGWTSSADLLENVGRASLAFYTKEEAINFWWVAVVADAASSGSTMRCATCTYTAPSPCLRRNLHSPPHPPPRSKKHGWNYHVEEPKQARLTRQKRYAGYGDNFRSVWGSGGGCACHLNRHCTRTAAPHVCAGCMAAWTAHLKSSMDELALHEGSPCLTRPHSPLRPLCASAVSSGTACRTSAICRAWRARSAGDCPAARALRT